MKALLVSLVVVAIFSLTPRLDKLASNHYLIKAEFENIGGLKTNSPIMIDGDVVGKVSAIDYNNHGYTALVSMLIEQGHRLPVDTTAIVLTSGLLAEHYIGLDPGAEQAYLHSGDLIKLTQPALAFEQVIGQLLYSRGQEDLLGEKSL
ncbi:MAG: MlaD family protein [Gammaproteobacteria bacterium]